jgi:hypothetical protein
LERLGILTEEQLNQRVRGFDQTIDTRISLNRRRMLFTVFGIASTVLLTSAGFPPVGGLLIARTLQTATTFTPTIVDNYPIENSSIRLRDVFDKCLSIIYKKLN